MLASTSSNNIRLPSSQTPSNHHRYYHHSFTYPNLYHIFNGFFPIISVEFGCVTLSFYFRKPQPQLQQFVLEDLSNFEMPSSCYMNSFMAENEKDSYDICDVYILEENDNVEFEQSKKVLKGRKNCQEYNIPYQMLPTAYTLENEYDSLIDQNSYNMEEYYYDENQEQEIDDDYSDVSALQEQEEENMMEKDYSDEEKQSVTHYSVNKNEVTSEEWQLENPKDKIIEIISEVEESSEDLSDYDKLETIKKRIKYYLFENQYHIFKEDLKGISGYSIKAIIKQIIKGIQQSFEKNIGKLSFEKRRLKILKYMEKKKVRDWRKRVNYNCRKDVADKRLRIKGKFVTQEQAEKQLGLQNLQGYSLNEIKELLQKKLEED